MGFPHRLPAGAVCLAPPGLEYMYLSPWIVVWPGLALSITVYGVNMFGDGLRDILDPRNEGRYRALRRKDETKPQQKCSRALPAIAGVLTK